MIARRTRGRMLALLVAGLVAAACGLVLELTGTFKHVEAKTLDARFDVRGKQTPNPDVVIVAYDAKSVDPKADQLDRKRLAAVIGQLSKAGAGSIAITPIDLQFSDQGHNPDADNALIDATRASRKVVLGTADVAPDGATGIFGGGDGLKFSRAIPGDTTYGTDPESPIRKVPFAPQHLQNFALKAVAVAGHPVRTPPGASDAWIDFPGPAGTIPRLSFADVEQGRLDPAAVKGKVVIVGATAPSVAVLHATSTSDAMSAPEIEAAAASTALEGFPLHAAAGWVGIVLAIALGLVAPLAALRFRIWFALGLGVLAIAAFGIGAQLAFSSGTIMKVAPPLAAGLLGLAGTIAVTAERTPAVDRFLDRVSPRGGNQRTRRLRAQLLILSALGIIVATLAADAGHVLRRQDLSTVDKRFAIRGKQKLPGVVVVSLEDQSITGKGRQWPIKRTRHAKVITELANAGAKVIAYDVQFTEPSGDTEADNALYTAVQKAAPRVVLSTTEVEPGGRTGILGGGDALAQSKAHPAMGNFTNDPDGPIRHMSFSIQGLRTFAMVTADVAAGHTVATPPGAKNAWIDYPGSERTLPYILFDDVEAGRFDPAEVKGKIVVVGASAPSLQDLHQTSTDSQPSYPGPEIQAVAAETALAGFPLRSGPGWLNVLLIVVLGAVTQFVALRVRRLRLSLAAGVLSIALLLVAAQLAFNNGTVVTVVYPALAGMLGLLVTAGIHGLTVAFEREQARDAFARFVPEAVVDQVLADAEGVRLGGVRGEATVMFSDLRGFTSFSETLEPERVIEALNRYLTEMSEAILDHGGTLVAYMGDGIMAVFGAPLKQSDHADRALEAAREMLERMEGFNGWLREQQLHDGFKMGIGLNSGPVMSGNVGSERRLEYTALGDTTNTAARLEGMTKGTPHQLYIADTTHKMLTRPAEDLVAVGEAEVRGRKAKVLLWSLRETPATPKPKAPVPPEPETVP